MNYFVRKTRKLFRSTQANYDANDPIATNEGGSSSASNVQQQGTMSYPHVEEDYIVRMETSDLMNKVQSVDNDQDRVIYIKGEPGIGKTTLARQVFADLKVKRLFDCCAWAFLAPRISIRDVLVKILIDVGPKENRMTWEGMKEDELVTTLRDVLKEKLYLVVLDDVFKIEDWSAIRKAFPDGKKGSKVLLTTMNAALVEGSLSVHEPPLFTVEEGLALVRKKVLLHRDSFQPEFADLGRSMVEKCIRFPLAIAVLGGLLATKMSLDDWNAVKEGINDMLEDTVLGVYGVLRLSYNHLPSDLQKCFLYLSQYPPAWEIHKKELIRMWIAEGFVPQVVGGSYQGMEELGEQYLIQLINRCVVEVSQTDHTGKGVKTCRIHDLIRDVCVTKAKEENFLQVDDISADGSMFDSSLMRTTIKLRRVAIHPSIRQRNPGDRPLVPVSERGNPRTLVYLAEPFAFRMEKQQGMHIFKHFRELRVLNLRNIYFQVRHIPTEIGNLNNLRYLGLRKTEPFTLSRHVLLAPALRLYTLPKSIGKLQHLFTLDLGNTSVKLPHVLFKLEDLRHLLLGKHCVVNHRLDTLVCLETLKWVAARSLLKKDALRRLTNLRNLGITFETTEEVEDVLKYSIFKSGTLCSLSMQISEKNSFQNLERLSHCQHLTKVGIYGEITEVLRSPPKHNLEYLPRHVVKLILHYSELKQDPMAILQELPSLRFLCLGTDSYKGSEMVCSADGFPKLEILQLYFLMQLENWTAEVGAMPCLKTLNLEGLKKLKKIPEGLLERLQSWTLKTMPKELERRCREQGEDFYKDELAAQSSQGSVTIKGRIDVLTQALKHAAQTSEPRSNIGSQAIHAQPNIQLEQEYAQEMKCLFAVSEASNIVAKGNVRLHGEARMTLHGYELGQRNLKVSIDAVFQSQAPLPYSTDELMPGQNKEAQQLLTLPGSDSKGKENMAKDTEISNAKQEHLKALVRKCETILNNDNIITINMPQSMGHTFDLPISKENVMEFARLTEISACGVMVYIKYIYEYVTKHNISHLYGFVSPFWASTSFGVTSDEQRAHMMWEALQDARSEQLFLAPYNGGGHWMLGIIQPWSSTVFWMDPLGNSIRDDFKNAVDRALEQFYSSNKTDKTQKALSVKPIKAPHQPDNIQCGYYVLRYIRDIVKNELTELNISTQFESKLVYTNEEITEIREEWALFLLQQID